MIDVKLPPIRVAIQRGPQHSSTLGRATGQRTTILQWKARIMD